MKNGNEQSVHILILIFLTLQVLVGVIVFFKLDTPIFYSIDYFLSEGKVSFNIFFLFLGVFYLFQKEMLYKYRLINCGICVLNLFFINKIYIPKNFFGMVQYIYGFLENMNVVTFFILLLFIIAIGLIVIKYNNKGRHTAQVKDVDSKTKMQVKTVDSKTKMVEDYIYEDENQNDRKQNNPAINNNTQKISNEVHEKESSLKFSLAYFVLCLFLTGVLGYFLIIKPELIRDVINNFYNVDNLNTLLLNIVVLVFFFIAIIYVVPYVLKLIYFNFRRSYIDLKENKFQDDVIGKIILSIVVIIIVYYLNDVVTNALDKLLNNITNNNFWVIPVWVILYLLIASIIIEISLELFSKKDLKVLAKLKEIVKYSTKSILKLIEGLAHSFFSLLLIIPDFINSLESLMFDSDMFDSEEDEKNSVENK